MQNRKLNLQQSDQQVIVSHPRAGPLSLILPEPTLPAQLLPQCLAFLAFLRPPSWPSTRGPRSDPAAKAILELKLLRYGQIGPLPLSKANKAEPGRAEM